MKARVTWPVTVRVVFAAIPPEVAVIVVEPSATPVASPPGATVAKRVALDAQITDDERSRVVPSEYVPVAVSCKVAPLCTVGFAGVIAIALSTAGVPPGPPLLPPPVPPPPPPPQAASRSVMNKAVRRRNAPTGPGDRSAAGARESCPFDKAASSSPMLRATNIPSESKGIC
jgi:hypothetical protein